MVSLANNKGEYLVNNNFLIEEFEIDLAKEICRFVEDSKKRNIAVATVLGAKVAQKFFDGQDIDTESGLHNIPQIFDKYDISDIYVNSSYIGVRLYFNENELCIPKSHFDNNICPIAYMFIQLNEDLSGGDVTGFVVPNNIENLNEKNGYYWFSEDDLVSYYEVESLLSDEEEFELPDNIDLILHNFVDGKVDDEIEICRILLKSKIARQKLISLVNAKNIFNIISLNLPKQLESNIEESQNVIEDTESIVFDENDNSDILEMESNDDLSLGSDDSIDLIEDSESDLLEEETTLESDSFELEDETDVLLEETVSSIDLVENSVTDLLEENNEEDSLELVDEIDNELCEEDENIHLLEGNDESVDILEESVTENFDYSSDSEEDSLTMFDDSEELLDNEDDLDLVEEVVEKDIEEDIVESDDTLEIVDYSEIETEEVLDNDTEFSIDEQTNEETIVQENSVTDNDDEILEEIAEYPTNVTPSIENYEYEEDGEELVEEEALDDLEISDTVETNNESEIKEENNYNQENIEELFNEESENSIQDQFISQKGNGLNVLPLFVSLIIISALGYFGYTKFFNNSPQETLLPEKKENKTQVVEKPKTTKTEAMPIETVENVEQSSIVNEVQSASIPVIEQNLGASISISNLSVNWEVPAAYTTNNTAKRYFTKIGKIIQLNLKTELMLLSRPPISNEIALELVFDKNTNKFNINKFIKSSGEKTVDNVIEQTVKKALGFNLNINTNSFANIAGNPVLIIRL